MSGWRGSYEDPAETVAALVAAFRSSGDATIILDASALAAARSALDTLRPQDLQVPVTPDVLRRLQVLGAFHWARSQLLPDARAQPDLRQALLLYATVQEQDPAAVPAPVSALLRQARQHQPAAHQPAPLRPAVQRPALPRPAPHQPAPHQPAGQQPAAQRPGAHLPAVRRSAPQLPAAQRHSGEDPAALNATAIAMMRQAEATRDYTAAGEAVRLLARAVSLAAPGDPARAEYLSNLGRVYRDLFRRDRDPAMLGHAIASHRQALAATRDGDPARPVRHFNLGNVLTDKHEHAADPEALAEGIRHLRAAVSAVPGESPLRPMFLANAGTALCDASELVEDDAMFAEGAALLREAAATAIRDDPRRSGYLRNLGKVTRTRYLRTSEASARDEAIDAYQRAAAAAVPLDPDRTAYLSAAMALLVMRAEDTRNTADIGQAGHAISEVLALLPADGADRADRARALALQGRVAMLRFELTGDEADLGRAAASYQQAAAMARDPAALGRIQAARADVLWTLYRRTGDLAWLDEALMAARQATGERPPGDTSPTLDSLTLLAMIATEKLRHTGADGLLDEAIAALHRGAALADPQSQPLAWANLAEALWEGSRQRQDRDMLAEAIALLRRSIRSSPPDDPRLADFLSYLCRALTEMFGWDGEQAALDEAISAGRYALTGAQAAGTGQILGLTNLGVALTRRFEHFGDAASLDEAIETLRLAGAESPDNPRERATVLVSLGNALVIRFGRSGAAADLDEGVTALRAAAGQLPAGHTDRPLMLGNLGGALLLSARALADRDAHPPDVPQDTPQDVAPDILMGAPPRGAHRRDTRAADGLDEAVAVLREAADTTPEGYPTRPIYLANLGSALFDRFRLRHDPSDLDAAVAALRQAAASQPGDGQPGDGTLGQQAGYLLSLAHAVGADAIRHGSEAPLAEAITILQAAAGAEAAPTADRVQAAREWADFASIYDLAGAASGYETAVGLLDLLAWRGLRHADQELLLEQFSGVASDAAAAAISAGQPGRAVELLEQGRGVLLAQAIDARAPYDALQRRAPALADRFTAVHDALEEPLRRSQAPLAAAAGDPRRISDRRHAATRERAALLAEIRTLPGFANFLRPPSADRLLRAARLGPVVLINVSRHRCDALALTGDDVRLIELPGLRHSDAGDRVTSFLAALDALPGPLGADPDTAPVLAARRVVDDTLHWSWDVIAGPVLDGLGITGRPAAGGPWPRIWWCPTGLLSFLPLHAAGYHDTLDAPVPATVLDRVASSYTPTVRILLHALREPAGQAGPDTRRALNAPLVVAMPATPGAADLPDSQREADYLAAGNPDGRVLTGPEATRGAVLSAIPQAHWIHFACHGIQDRSQPSRSRLLLHDGPLAIQEIAAIHAEQAELAYLSACETFSGGTTLPDEAITLASAVQLAGYRHVIGAQWPVADGIAPDMARRVYTGIRESGVRDTGMAVHDAVRALRRSWPNAPAIWAPYVHVGP